MHSLHVFKISGIFTLSALSVSNGCEKFGLAWLIVFITLRQLVLLSKQIYRHGKYLGKKEGTIKVHGTRKNYLFVSSFIRKQRLPKDSVKALVNDSINFDPRFLNY